MYKLASRLLRVALIVLLLGSLLAQVLVPVYVSQVGTRFPGVAYLVVPYSVAAILFIGCGQVVLLVIACAAVATALSAGVSIHVGGFVPGGGGPMIYYLAVCITSGPALVLLMVVMRGVLESATPGRTELGESF